MEWPLLVYRLLLPVYVLVSAPGWWLKMVRRGGLGSGLSERFGIYTAETEFEPCGAVHVHAVSVGETMLALKLIRRWRELEPGRPFVLAVATATGRAVADSGAPEGVRVVYQPVDFRWLVKRYLDRFEPSQVVLVEGEMWPHLMLGCAARGVPVRLVNARMSPRSKRRYAKFASWVRPVFRHLSGVGVQEAADAPVWSDLGVAPERVEVTGSLKFDPGRGRPSVGRPEFGRMVAACRGEKPVVLAASTHAGEESLLAGAIVEAGGFPVIVPRHAERRGEVVAELTERGFRVVLRSAFSAPRSGEEPVVLVVDSTGELRDWLAEAAVIVVGKSFRGGGGQNPAEAIEAGKPVVFGPMMENFEPLATRLVDAGGALRTDEAGLAGSLRGLLEADAARTEMAAKGARVLSGHAGATERIIGFLGGESDVD